MQYRQHAARSLGEFFKGNANRAMSTTTALVDNTSPVLSSVRSAQTYKDWWLFRPNAALTADQLRVVAVDAPTTGTLTVDNAWTNAPTTNEAYELHGIVEPMTQMTELINQTLKRCFVTVEVSFSPANALNTRDNITSTINATYFQPEWVRDVGYLASGEVRDQINPYQRRIRGWASGDYTGSAVGNSGINVYLNHPAVTFPTNATIYVLIIKRAYDHCGTSSAALGTQSGLTLDTDAAAPAIEWVTAGVLCEAWERFGHVMDATSNQRLIRDQASAAQWFESQSRANFKIPPLYFRRMDWWGPLPVGPGVFSY